MCGFKIETLSPCDVLQLGYTYKHEEYISGEWVVQEEETANLENIISSNRIYGGIKLAGNMIIADYCVSQPHIMKLGPDTIRIWHKLGTSNIISDTNRIENINSETLDMKIFDGQYFNLMTY